MRRLGRRTVYTPRRRCRHPPRGGGRAPPDQREVGMTTPPRVSWTARQRDREGAARPLSGEARPPRGGCRRSRLGVFCGGGGNTHRCFAPPPSEGGACGGLRPRAPKRRGGDGSELAPAPSARGLPLAAGGVHRARQRYGVRFRAKPGPLEGAVGEADWGCFAGGGAPPRCRSPRSKAHLTLPIPRALTELIRQPGIW